MQSQTQTEIYLISSWQIELELNVNIINDMGKLSL